MGRLEVGSQVNLERAMKLSDRIGGHLVSGHVDAIGHVAAIAEEGFSSLMTFELDGGLAPYFVEKGSVAIEGVSLTVVEPTIPASLDDKFQFKVALIPHTMQVTTLGNLKVGTPVNIETDVVARYVARWASPYLAGQGENLNKEGAKQPFKLGQS